MKRKRSIESMLYARIAVTKILIAGNIMMVIVIAGVNIVINLYILRYALKLHIQQQKERNDTWMMKS